MNHKAKGNDIPGEAKSSSSADWVEEAARNIVFTVNVYENTGRTITEEKVASIIRSASAGQKGQKSLGESHTDVRVDSQDSGDRLAPCPFCGSTDLETDSGSIECRNCGTMGPCAPFTGKETERIWWNRRAPEPQSVASTQEEAGASPNKSGSVASAGRAEKWEDVIKQAYAAVAETSKGLATVDKVADHWSKASRIFELYADEARERAELHGASLSAGDTK